MNNNFLLFLTNFRTYIKITKKRFNPQYIFFKYFNLLNKQLIKIKKCQNQKTYLIRIFQII